MKRAIALLFICGCLSSIFAQMPANTPENIKKYTGICKTNIYKEMKGMYREAGGALKFPFLAPGSAQYLDMLWDWDSWLSNVALKQILLENGSDKDKQQAVQYEEGCVLNFLHYGGMDGWIPIWIERNAPSRDEMLSKINPWKSKSTTMEQIPHSPLANPLNASHSTTARKNQKKKIYRNENFASHLLECTLHTTTSE